MVTRLEPETQCIQINFQYTSILGLKITIYLTDVCQLVTAMCSMCSGTTGLQCIGQTFVPDLSIFIKYVSIQRVLLLPETGRFVWSTPQTISLQIHVNILIPEPESARIQN